MLLLGLRQIRQLMGAAVVVALLASCGTQSAQSVSAPTLALHQADLPPGWTISEENDSKVDAGALSGHGEIISASADPQAHGPVGPTSVEVFPDSASASKSIYDLNKTLGAKGTYQLVSVPTLGEESTLWKETDQPGFTGLEVIWRYKNVRAQIIIADDTGADDQSLILRIAAAQETRIRTAMGG